MANYNKSFNFRNGVQVDQDNFLVDSLGRVGIGTSIARTDLDVYGNAAINGRLDTINSISSGIATFTGTVKVGTGITMYAASGIISATYYGDGSNLSNLPTSQWIDVDPSSAYTSIYAAGNVGIATTNPGFTFQIGNNPNNPSGIGTAYGLGISSEGNVRTSGIITAKSFVGSGAGVTSINADNISTGTLSASLFSNINSSGIATIGTLGVTGTSTTRNLQVTGVTTVGFITATNLYVGIATIGTLGITTATISSLTVTQNVSFDKLEINTGITTNLSVTGIATIGTLGVTGTSTTRNLQVTGVTTVGFITATNLYVSGIATIGTVKGDYLNVGIGTITSFTSTYSQIGISTATTFKATNIESTGVTTSPKIFSGNVQISNTANTIDTSSSDLKLDAFTKKVSIENDLYVTRGTYLAGIATVAIGLVPDDNSGAYLGQSGKAFSDAYIDNIQISVTDGSTIDTGANDLKLDASTKKVSVTNDLSVGRNLSVTGVSTFSQVINVAIGLVPDDDGGAYIGTSGKAFSEAYIDGVQIGVGGTTTIDTRGGDLVLNAPTNKVSVSNDLSVGRNTYITGIATVALGLVPDADVGAYLGQSNNAFEKAYISGVQIGVGGTTTIDTRGGDLILDSFTDNVIVNNNLLLPEKLYVGSGSYNYNTLYVDGPNNKVGIGTSAPTKDFEFKRQGDAEFAIISNTANAKLTVSSGNTSSYFKINPTTYELSIINDYPANVSNYIHAGDPGISTGDFKWIYGQNNAVLMSLSYNGNLNINGINTTHKLYVGGSSSISGNSWVGDNLRVLNNITANSISAVSYALPSIISNVNLNNTSGVSTFFNINIRQTGQLLMDSTTRIGIGSTQPRAQLDIFGFNLESGGGGIYASSVAIGTDASVTNVETLDNFPGQEYGLYLKGRYIGVDNGALEMYNSSFITMATGDCRIGIGTTVYRAMIDFADAGKSVDTIQGAFMLPPRLNNSQRAGLATEAGAFIYNTSTNRHQGYNGTSWFDFY